MRYALVLCLFGALVCPGAVFADAVSLNFDQFMNNAWGATTIWNLIELYEVLPPDFELTPGVCDINGGFDISQVPIILYPNGMLDSDEFALVASILANPSFDCTGAGGTSHEQVHQAWTNNLSQMRTDMGGGVGGPEVLLGSGALVRDLDYLFAVMMTLGDSDTLAFPLLILDYMVNEPIVQAIVNDPNVKMPDPENYIKLYPYLGWCGDADGDGCSNLSEYEYYYPTGGRGAYIAAAMNPAMAPPGCSNDRLCEGTGGLFGEYFTTRSMTPLGATRMDPMISFDWGNGKPHPDIAENNFSVCWTGWVTPNHSEAYTFHVRTDDGVRLWVNNELLVNQWNDHGPTTYSGTTSTVLQEGQEYPIRMDFYENGGGAVAWLGWESASQPKKAIYEMNLRPSRGLGDRGLDWIRSPHNGHYYKLTEPMTWEAGRDLALTPGWDGYLVTINDATENAWIQMTFGPVVGDFFIGASDLGTEGRWAWTQNDANFWNGAVDGSVVPGFYANWNSGEPNDSGGNEDVAHMYSGSGLWNDLAASAVRRCLVESELGRITYEGPTPATCNVFEGALLELRVEAFDTFGAVTYQWFKDGVEVPGATQATLRLSPTRADDAGAYTCYISDETPAYIETAPAYVTVISAAMLPAAGIVAHAALVIIIAAAFRLKRRGLDPLP